MNTPNKKLLIEQVDRKLSQLKPMGKIIVPKEGWVSTIRTAMNMSLRQLGNRLKISAQSVKEIEEREANGSITIKSLRQVANKLDMKFVYGVIPKKDSIEKIIEKRANEVACEIVSRTSNTMKLEDQENSKARIATAIKHKVEEIKNKMPKYLWD